MKFLRMTFLIASSALLLSLLLSCSTTTEFKINGIEMPRDVQVNVIRLSPYGDDSISVFSYYVREYGRTINARGISEVVFQKQPLDLTIPKTMDCGTLSVGINVFIYNPNFLRFRVVTSDPVSLKKKTRYEGIRDHYEFILYGPVSCDREHRISARVDLMGESGSFVVDSAEIGDLVYTVKSSRKN